MRQPRGSIPGGPADRPADHPQALRRRAAHPRRRGARLLLAALAGALLAVTAATSAACTAAPAKPPPDPTAPAQRSPAPPRATMDPKTMCAQLLPLLGRATTIVTDYLRQPEAVNRTALAETADQLMILHDGAPDTLLKDLGTEIDTLLSIEEHLLGKRSAITNVEGYRSAGLRLMAACEPYVK